MSNKKKKNILIFGLDGVTFALLDKWMENGDLPYLSKLVKGGVRADLRSTLPPVTGPAWTSFQTGTNPGKHGIFDWGSSEEGSYGEGMVDSTHIQTDTIWEILSRAGREVGVIGLPVTYPPREVRGFVLTGLLTPNNADDYVYPKSLEGDIRDAAGEYVTAPAHAEMALNTRAWIRELNGSIENREKVSIRLLRDQPWDVSLVYFMETDTVMHHLYHTLDDKDNRLRSGLRSVADPVLTIHQRVEQAVHHIIDEVAEPHTDIILVSDHGFGPLDWIFNVNSWLWREGYLSLKDRWFTKAKRIMQKVGINQKNLYHLGNLLGPLGRSKKWDMQGFNDILGRMFLSMDDVDWEDTKAFSRGGVTGEIRLNIQGRGSPSGVDPSEVQSLREQLITDLEEIRSPYTGENVVDKVLERELVYSGPQSHLGPDILFTTKDMRTDTGGLTVFKSMKPIMPTFALTGTHRMEGIFVGSGPSFKAGARLDELSIMDMAPTLLNLLDLPIPSYMDGRPAKASLASSFSKEHPPRYKEVKLSSPEDRGQGKTDGEDEEIRERLKSLGYLS
ncbi:MAG: alkaline phosphatase family protein [Candidatus Acetothermia bacterium]